MRRWPRARSHPDPDRPRATYARVLDGETLWLAVTGTTTVELGGEPVALTPQGGVRAARVPLSERAEDLALTCDDEPLRPSADALDDGPLTTPPTRDGRWQWAVVDDDGLRVRRTPRPVETTLLDAWADGGQLVVRLRSPNGVSPELMLLDGEDEIARVRVVDGVARIPGGLVPRRPGAVVGLGVGAPGVPVRRARNALRWPGAAVVLPGIGEGDEFAPYLRWLRDGRLALARPGGDER